MNRKLVIICKNCHCRIGITFDHVVPVIFCTECEAVECTRREVAEEYERQYHAALNRS